MNAYVSFLHFCENVETKFFQSKGVSAVHPEQAIIKGGHFMKTNLKKTFCLMIAVIMFVIILPTVAFATSTGGVAVNQTNFPDEIFRSEVSQFDINNDFLLDEQELAVVKIIECEGLYITSLKGIELFTNLEELYCKNNRITELDLSRLTKLKELDCSENRLRTLDVSANTKLFNLNAAENQIDTLNFGTVTSIKTLNVNRNRLKALNVIPFTELEVLHCYGNQIEILNVILNNKLYDLGCGTEDKTLKLNLNTSIPLKSLTIKNANMTTFDARPFRNLKDLSLQFMPELTYVHFDLTNKLDSVILYKTGVIEVDLSNSILLEKVSFSNNDKLEKVDVSGCNALRNLRVEYSPRLTSLDINGTALTRLVTEGSPVERLVVGQLPSIRNLVMYVTPERFTGCFRYRGGSNGFVCVHENTEIITDPSLREICKYYFPNDAFRNYVSDNIDTNHDGFLSDEERNSVTTLNLSGKNILRLNKGLELFPNLEVLNVYNNRLVELDISKNPKLKKLYCDRNQLESINVYENPFLREVVTSGQIDPYYTTLKRYYANGGEYEIMVDNSTVIKIGLAINEDNFPDSAFRNSLRSYDTDNDMMLDTDEINRITSFNIVNVGCTSLEGIEYLSELTSLNCSQNNLTSLNLYRNTNLQVLDCSDNNLTGLYVAYCPNIREVYCANNNLQFVELGTAQYLKVTSKNS